MDKVTPKCPYCGTEMELDRTYKSMMAPEAGVAYWYSCDVCGSESPRCNTPESAYAAATARYQPENRVLTLEELRNHEMPCGMWIEWRDEQRVLSEQTVGMCLLYQGDSESIPGYGTRWRAWLRRPTDEERAATPWAQIDA